MTGWPTRTLGELCAEGGGFIRTGPFGSQLHQSDYTGDPCGIPVVMPKDMASGRIDLSSIARIDTATAQRLQQHLLAENDVVLSRRGDVGRSAWVAAEDLPAFCGTGSMRVHLGQPKSVRPGYLRYFFRSRLSSDYLEGHAVGATMPNLNATIVGNLPVPVLPQELQDAASEVLATLDDLVENLRRRAAVLEEMARATYREWFVHFRYPGLGHPYDRSADSSQLPAGWIVLPFVDIASFVNGFAFGPAHWTRIGRPIVKIKELKQGVSDSTPRCDRELVPTKYWVEPGDLLFSWSADLGAYRWAGEPALLNQHLFTVQPIRDHVSAAFLFQALTEAMPGFQLRAQGTTMRHIKRSALTEVQTIVPPGDILGHFTDVVEPIHQMAIRLQQVERSAIALRDLLLPRLLAGDIDVSALDLHSLIEGSVA